jgi:hypothetical protein
VKPRTFLLALLALAVAIAAAVLFILRLTEPEAGPAVSAPPAAPLVPPPPPMTGTQTITPPEVADPVEARKLEVLIEARSRYQALRDGFTGPGTEAPRQRLEPALRALWPGQPPAFTVGCRGRVCRVEGPGDPAAWRAELAGSPAVARVADQVAVDPDGVEKPAFVLVSEGRPGSGEDLLGSLERSLRESDEAASCLEGGAPGTVEVELQVDQSGVTFRAAGTAPLAVVDCVSRAAAELAGATRVAPTTQAATRTVVLERRR